MKMVFIHCSRSGLLHTMLFLLTLVFTNGVEGQNLGKSLNFGGSNDYITIGRIDLMDVTSNPDGNWTIECWFKSSQLQNYENLFHTDFNPSGSNNGARVELNTGTGTWGYLGKLYVYGLGLPN